MKFSLHSFGDIVVKNCQHLFAKVTKKCNSFSHPCMHAGTKTYSEGVRQQLIWGCLMQGHSLDVITHNFISLAVPAGWMRERPPAGVVNTRPTKPGMRRWHFVTFRRLEACIIGQRDVAPLYACLRPCKTRRLYLRGSINTSEIWIVIITISLTQSACYAKLYYSCMYCSSMHHKDFCAVLSALHRFPGLGYPTLVRASRHT